MLVFERCKATESKSVKLISWAVTLAPTVNVLCIKCPTSVTHLLLGPCRETWRITHNNRLQISFDVCQYKEAHYLGFFNLQQDHFSYNFFTDGVKSDQRDGQQP